MSPIPPTPAAWLAEIAAAYEDAREALAFAPAVGADVREEDLFHLAPAVCIKFRALRPTGAPSTTRDRRCARELRGDHGA
jgi:hypothetical protein